MAPPHLHSHKLNPFRISLSVLLSLSISTHTSTNAAPAVPNGWNALGCYTDSIAARSLQNLMIVAGQMTVDKCIAACEAGGFTLAGVEYANECFCDNAFRNDGGPAPDGNAQCNMACAGNAAQLCGGSNRLNVYRFGDGTVVNPPPPSQPPTTPAQPPANNGWNALGCYTDDINTRTLGIGLPLGAQNSIGACQTQCLNNGFVYAGMEYGAECFCDSALRNGGGPAPDGNAQCNMACAGNAQEVCGGPNRLSMYRYTGTIPNPTNPPAPPPPPPPANPPAGGGGGTAKPVTSGLQVPWHYAACYIDNAHGRVLGFQQPDSNALTVEGCINACNSLGYTLAGMEFGVQCFCDNNVINGGVKASQDNDCGMGCGGNANQACGGPNRMSIYSKTQNVVELPVPSAQTTGLPGNWKYQGCITEVAGARTFPYLIEMGNKNTAESCLSLCSRYGYPAAGLEFGVQCFCGDITDTTKNGVAVAPEADCNMPCGGDPVHLCGGPNRLSYYAWQGALSNWQTPQGNAKGQYQFLIGGVVIPLVTTLGINNKVTFVEKLGTGPPNSTGAYELDLSLVNDFNRAWRTMHVKSDVFCSGGLTLPDKAGRQINIGGWSLESTEGVRLYWPDGRPGVPGVNDWQENHNEVRLQEGRWYPGVMIMANGSILVVGGEEGSNGPPVPSLEILPAPAGGNTFLFMDWLQRTDPNNLYPYLFVLPGGGIFVIYYNEARILNEVTFETTRVLPKIPGAVNDATGGRTYPLEGTAVMLPQKAPYTDPVTVMVCGGSTLGPAIALDNCVSIQPEVPNAQWVIERMPSKRVMTCMATLPDGTFLILNGAQQGVAGFGLATEPNLNAVLYDPSKPVGSRFSIMANTIVARLYHSEATLLQDGRVLVTGSDPQDTRFPQEYRVEVFVPPYLLNGAARPTFTIANTDWAYNSANRITVMLPTGNFGAIRVSLIAAVTSTHGTSMNQRILFPAVGCAGNVCTITAPPNAHVCPPGWFQLFVLDGPTPSLSTWVRIGGDPARLGNWPPFPDFDKPGL